MDVLVRGSTIAAPRRAARCSSSSSPTLNNLFGKHEALTLAYAGAVPFTELQFVAPSYRQVLNSEGLTVLRQRQLQLGLSRPSRDAGSSISAPAAPSSKPALSYPIIRSREKQPDRDRRWPS